MIICDLANYNIWCYINNRLSKTSIFGKSSLRGDFLKKNHLSFVDLKKNFIDDIGIAGFAFGDDEAPCNNFLSRIIEEESKRLNAIIFVQSDIHIKDSYQPTYIRELANGNPPTTYRMANETIKWAKSNGIKTLYIAAATPHVWRVKRDLQKIIAEKKLDINLELLLREKEREAYPYDSWFSEYSGQVHTKSKFNWWRREIIFMLMPFLVYEIVSEYYDNKK